MASVELGITARPVVSAAPYRRYGVADDSLALTQKLLVRAVGLQVDDPTVAHDEGSSCTP